MPSHYVVDFGSRSVKLHCLDGEQITQARTLHWDPINLTATAESIVALLECAIATVPPNARIDVIGTAAARRDPRIATGLAMACGRLGISYQTITQEREAELILEAFGTSLEVDVVNAGGGSIQIVPSAGAPVLLSFGISDLNRRFRLDDRPAIRLLDSARMFLRDVLPPGVNPFVYTGGERAYLLSLGARLDEQSFCTTAEFLRVTRPVETLPTAELERMSPFDPGWMRGAVASNLIVEILLERGGLDGFIPSDANIADGMISRIVAEHDNA